MRNVLIFFLAGLLMSGCATVEISDEGGREMVVISNSSWYLFNLIPLASGNPEKVNKVSCSLFSEKATLENNIKILDEIAKESGVKTVKSLKSFWTDESIFIIFMKRHVIHTSAEFVYDGNGKERKCNENNESDSQS